MRCPKCYSETPAEALQCPVCKLVTPKGRTFSKGKQNKATAGRKPSARRTERKSRRVGPAVSVLATVGAALIFGVGSFLAVIGLESYRAPQDGSRIALDKLRSQPSSEAGLTLDERLAKEVEKSREAGTLVEAEGWDVKPLEETRFAVVFSYEEKGNLQRRAEWNVDIASNTFTPVTELAAALSRR